MNFLFFSLNNSKWQIFVDWNKPAHRETVYLLPVRKNWLWQENNEGRTKTSFSTKVDE